MKLSLFWNFLNMHIFQIWIRIWKTFRRLLEDFLENFWKTLRNSRKTLGRLSKKSSNVFYARRLPTKSSRSLPKSYAQSGYKGMMSSGVQTYLCWGMISSSMCNIFVYGLFYDLYVYYFSCELFYKLEEMLNKRTW